MGRVPDAVDPDGEPIWLDRDGRRDFTPRTQLVVRGVALIFLGVTMMVTAYAVLALLGYVPPAPWSPIAR